MSAHGHRKNQLVAEGESMVKSPLHPSALTINDMNIGRRILMVNLFWGTATEGTVVSEPYQRPAIIEPHSASSLREDETLVIDIRLRESGETVSYDLGFIGVMRIPAGQIFINRWSLQSFVIDARKHKLLPALTPLEVIIGGISLNDAEEIGLKEAIAEKTEKAEEPTTNWPWHESVMGELAGRYSPFTGMLVNSSGMPDPFGWAEVDSLDFLDD